MMLEIGREEVEVGGGVQGRGGDGMCLCVRAHMERGLEGGGREERKRVERANPSFRLLVSGPLACPVLALVEVGLGSEVGGEVGLLFFFTLSQLPPPTTQGEGVCWWWPVLFFFFINTEAARGL